MRLNASHWLAEVMYPAWTGCKNQIMRSRGYAIVALGLVLTIGWSIASSIYFPSQGRQHPGVAGAKDAEGLWSAEDSRHRWGNGEALLSVKSAHDQDAGALVGTEASQLESDADAYEDTDESAQALTDDAEVSTDDDEVHDYEVVRTPSSTNLAKAHAGIIDTSLCRCLSRVLLLSHSLTCPHNRNNDAHACHGAHICSWPGPGCSRWTQLPVPAQPEGPLLPAATAHASGACRQSPLRRQRHRLHDRATHQSTCSNGKLLADDVNCIM
jgi:hypothetical protein